MAKQYTWLMNPWWMIYEWLMIDQWSINEWEMNNDGINAKINSIGNLLIPPNIYSSPIKRGFIAWKCRENHRTECTRCSNQKASCKKVTLRSLLLYDCTVTYDVTNTRIICWDIEAGIYPWISWDWTDDWILQLAPSGEEKKRVLRGPSFAEKSRPKHVGN